MIEVIYKAPADVEREQRIDAAVKQSCGRLTFREEPQGGPSESVCLTYEFDTFQSAVNAASELRSAGEHIEGPSSYGE